MGARPKHDIAPLVRTAFVNALVLIEKDTGKTLPEMMRDCIEQHGLLAVLDRLSKYTVRERHTTRVNETIISTDEVTAAAIDSWIAGFASASRGDKAQSIQGEINPPSQSPDKSRIQ